MQSSFYHMGLNRHFICYLGAKHDFAAIRKHEVVKGVTALCYFNSPFLCNLYIKSTSGLWKLNNLKTNPSVIHSEPGVCIICASFSH